MTPDTLFTVKELAEYVNQPVAYIRKALKSGKLRYQQLVEHGIIRVKLAWWEEYIESTAIVATPDGGRRMAPKRRKRVRGAHQRSENRRNPASYKDISF